MDKKKIKELELFAAEIRLETTKEVAKRGFGHLPGSLSVADALAVLYGDVMRIRPKEPKWEGRDLMVMSKGHAGPAVYATLALKGFFPMEELATLNQPGTNLPSHCDRNKTVGVDMTTGSLGQGVSTAIGMALGHKLAGDDVRTYLIVGDGECDEGQVWEGMLFAHQQKLDHLTVFVDYNKKQLDGTVEEVMDLGDIEAKFKAFGFHTENIDGNNVAAILETLAKCREVKDVPSCIILNTLKGKGITEVEEMKLNHHIQVDPELAKKAIAELTAEVERLKGETANV